MKKSKFSEWLDSFVSGKGFYIALFVCIAVIGVTSWAILFAGRDDPDGQITDAMYSSSVSVSRSTASDKDVDISSDTQKPDASESTVSEADSSSVEEKPDTAEDASVSIPDEDPAEVDVPEDPVLVSAEDAVYVWPVVGEVLTAHSLDTLVYNITMADWRTHDGVDIAAEKGVTVSAASAGLVSSVYDDDLYGTTVVIDHGNGLKSVYSNLAALPTVSPGDTVSVGEVIGSVGSTAIGEINEQSHLHLSMTMNDESVDPLDYLPELSN